MKIETIGAYPKSILSLEIDNGPLEVNIRH